ncbi:MAG: ABC transporter substrate-binding protein, partial [Polyangiales bacterium]
LSRREWLIGAAGLVACSSDRRDAAHASEGARDTLTIAFDGAGVSAFALDPHNSGYAPHNRVMRSIYDSLTRLLPDQSIGPWLAESWELSPERTQYVFKLRGGVTFHDGTPFDAAALKYNFDRLADEKNVLSSRAHLGPYVRSEVLAPDRLRVELSEPYTPFLRNLSTTKLGIVSPAAVEKYGKTFAQNPVATGPYRFVELKPGTEIRLARNADYRWAPPSSVHQGPAKFAKLNFINVPEESTRVAVLVSGQADAADLIPPQNLASLRKDARFTLLERELLNTNYALTLNVTHQPWDDADMRRAVRLSLDIDAIVRTIYLGNYARAWSVLSPGMLGSAERLLADSWKPDPARAKQILEQKGWKTGPNGTRVKGGKPLTIRFIDSQGNREKRLDVIKLVRRQLQDVGVDLFVDSQQPGVTSIAMTENKHDLAAGAIFHGDPDVLSQSYDPDVRTSLSGNRVVDHEIIGWLREAAHEPDGPRRAELYHHVQRKILDQTYAIPIYVLPYNIATRKRLHGVSLDEHGFPEFVAAYFADGNA